MKENFIRHEYIIKSFEIGAISGKLKEVESGIRCPNCKKEFPLIEHGEIYNCSCGLQIQCFGNSLECELKNK